MGYNTTVVVMNDALGDIEKDTEFGKNLAHAILQAIHRPNCPIRVGARSHSTAALVVETHHADTNVVVWVGENMGVIMEDGQLIGVAEMAEQLNMRPDAIREKILWRNGLRATKLAGRWVVLRKDFERFIKNREYEVAHAK